MLGNLIVNKLTKKFVKWNGIKTNEGLGFERKLDRPNFKSNL